MTKYEQQLVGEYGAGMQDYINQQRTLGKGGDLVGSNVDKQDVSRIIANYQKTVPPPTAQNVYSAGNINQAVSAPAQTPNLADPMGIYDFYMNSGDIQQARERATTAQKAVLEAQQKARDTQYQLGEGMASMKTITGRQARAGELSNIQLQALAETLGVEQSNLQALTQTAQQRADIALSQRDQLTQLIVNNPGAGVTYTDTVETASQKINQYQEKKLKEEEAKAKKATEDAYKEKLRGIAMELGVSLKTKKGGTMNTKQLEDAIAKKNKKALEDAKAWEEEQKSMERTKFAERNMKTGTEKIELTEEEKLLEKKLESVAKQVESGAINREQAVAQLEGFGLSTDKAGEWVYNKYHDGYEYGYGIKER